MAVKKRENTFEKLNKVDVSKFTKKKGKFSYLSWCFAVQELLRVYPEATWEVHLFNCLENVINRYELVLLASKRARQIALGSEPLVPPDDDKPTVIALREIAENLVNTENVDKINQPDTDEELSEDAFGLPPLSK